MLNNFHANIGITICLIDFYISKYIGLELLILNRIILFSDIKRNRYFPISILE